MKKQGQKVLVERWRKGTGVVPPVNQAKTKHGRKQHLFSFFHLIASECGQE